MVATVRGDSTTRRNGFWHWLAALLALGQLCTPPVVSRLYGDFLSTGPTNEAVITPAGYAFSIWGLITLLSLVTCLTVLRKGLGTPCETRILCEASLVFVGFAAWLFAAAQNWLWLTVTIFVVMAAALLDILRHLVRQEPETSPTWPRRLATVTFGLYLGWSSVAVFANVAAALVGSGWPPTGTVWQAVILVVATIAAAALTVYLRATPGYVAAASWALIAVAVGCAQRGVIILSVSAAAAAVAIAGTAASVLLVRRRMRR